MSRGKLGDAALFEPRQPRDRTTAMGEIAVNMRTMTMFSSSLASWKRSARRLGCVVAVAGAFPALHAAEVSMPAPEEAEGAVVLVTAERRHQSPQKVPISMTVLSATGMEKANIGSVAEMQKLVPGLAVTEAATGHNQVFIRGIGTDIVGAGVEGAVAVYVDGVYESRAIGETMRFIDVERVEVLKGPQGVLYGRNATGGAINIVSKAPTRESFGQVEAGGGSFGRRALRGTISGPLSEGAAYGRLSLLYDRNDGDTRNTLLNVKANGADIRGWRAALDLTPDDDFDLTVNAVRYRDDFSPTVKPLHPEANPLFTVFNATVIDDPRTVMANQAMSIGLTRSAIDVTARWRFDAAQLTSITAWRRIDYDARSGDLDGTEVPLLRIGPPAAGDGVVETTRFFSQDFTLTSAGDGRLNWTGLFSYSRQNVDAPAFNMTFPLLNLSQNSAAVVKTDALALGGQATYALSDRLRVTGGARFSTETKNLESLRTFFNGAPTASMSDTRKWSAVTPKLVVDYSPDRHSMIYVSATKGFKSGGFNTTSAQAGFDPETAINYEAGFKGKWLDGRLLANLSAFHTRYDDMQVSVVLNNGGALASTIQNAAKAVSRGIEASIAAKPTTRLDLSAALQLLRARIVEFVSVDARFPAAGPLDQKGNPLSRAPDVTANLAAEYAWPVPEGGRLSLRGECVYRSKIYFTPFKNDYASAPAVTVWNAMLSYEPASRRGAYAAAFVKNLTDRTYPANVFDPQSLGYLAYMAPGRSLGVRVGYRY